MVIKSCMNCQWYACRNYGYNRPICFNYIAEYKSNNLERKMKMLKKEKLYGIKNIETGMILAKNNLFTNDESMWFKTNRHDAGWLLEQFWKENIYNVR